MLRDRRRSDSPCTGRRRRSALGGGGPLSVSTGGGIFGTDSAFGQHIGPCGSILGAEDSQVPHWVLGVQYRI